MNDPSTDETIRTAFADLRSGEGIRLAPPGTDAARRTVRRRRLTTSATAAGFTAVLLLGAGYVAATGAGQPRPDREAGPVAAASDGETVPSEEPGDVDQLDAQHLAEVTAEALGEQGDRTIVAHLGLGDPGFRVTDVDNDDRPSEPVVFSWTGIEAGEYLLRIACGGEDEIAITLRFTTEESTIDEAETTARCATTVDDIADGVGEAGPLTVPAEAAEDVVLAQVVFAAEPGPQDHRAIALALIPQ
jgi:hypothetical protein